MLPQITIRAIAVVKATLAMSGRLTSGSAVVHHSADSAWPVYLYRQTVSLNKGRPWALCLFDTRGRMGMAMRSTYTTTRNVLQFTRNFDMEVQI